MILCGRSYTSVNTAMDWHFAMMNDVPRCDFNNNKNTMTTMITIMTTMITIMTTMIIIIIIMIIINASQHTYILAALRAANIYV